MNREQMLLQEIQKILPAGASIEAELQKYPGHTKTQRMIKLLESHNEERLTGQSIEGYFTGSFESKGHYYWRLTMTNGTAAIVSVDNTQLKPPEFGQKIQITNVDKIHFKVSDRDSFALAFDAQYTVLPGHVIDVAPDINDAPEGYGLIIANLYDIGRVGDGKNGYKSIINEKGFNLKITVRGEEGPDRRYASGFINDLPNLLALVPQGDQVAINDLLETDDDLAVIDALKANCFNKNFDFKGASLLIYGKLDSHEGRDRTFWNIGIMKIFNTDNLGVEVHRFAESPELDEATEKSTQEELEEAFTKIAVKDNEEKKEEKADLKEITPAEEPTTVDDDKPGHGFTHNSAIDMEIKETIMAALKIEPTKAMELVNKVIEESGAGRQECVDNMTELFEKKFIITKDRKYQVAKEL